MREPVDGSMWSERTMLALAEQLKTPLVQIAQLSELQDGNVSATKTIAEAALRSIDAFLRAEQQTALGLEPVSVGAVFYDVAHELSPLAKEWGVKLEIDERTRSMPVMAHHGALHSLLALLGSVLVQSPQDAGPHDSRRVLLGCRRASGGVVVGVFGGSGTFSSVSLAATRALYGRASQASPETGLQGAASIMIADKLSQQMQTVLKAYTYGSLKGMGALLVPSKQLQLLS